MRIGILGPISWRIPPRHYGGWELVTHNLVEGLVRRGHDVTLFATEDSSTSAKLASICPKPLSEDSTLSARLYESLHTALTFEHAGEFDLVHNHLGCYPVCYSRVIPVPLVTTLHGSAAEGHSRVIYNRYRDSNYVSITDAERILAPELNYIATVYNGIDVAAFDFNPTPGDYLLVLGRMSPDKGIHSAIAVAQRLGMRLILAGIVPPENQEYFDTQVKPQLQEGFIDYVGPADHKQKNRLLREAYAFLHLIGYHEAFGLTMVESMACGTPVIAVPMGSVPEIVIHGETGFFANNVEEVCRLLPRIAELDRMRCRQLAEERFNVDQMVDGYVKVYRRVLGAE
ncbi:MAG TPA: glycosyltransferase family 4 protein [Chloroflexota bacterium]|nr:glycosyltransferase family 4 protein [Chloroflexota bacterium]